MHDGWKNVERAVVMLAVVAVSLAILAGVLPRVLLPASLLIILFVLVRLVLFHTRRW
jgi:hypothetical protein